jgi:hypothetical protein
LESGTGSLPLRLMNRILSTLTLILSGTLLSMARDRDELKVKTSPSSLGIHLITGREIKSVKHVFPYDVYAASIDTVQNEIIVLAKVSEKAATVNRGFLALYDMAADTFKWQQAVNMFDPIFTKEYIVLANSNGSACYQRSTGKFLWKNDFLFLRYIDDVHHIGVSSRGKGLDMKTGKTIWSRKLSSEEYWTDLAKLNDTTVAIISGGLQVMNIKTGEGARHRDKHKKVDYTGAIVAAAGGVVAGALTGSVFITMSVSSTDVTEGLGSQILVEGDRLYFAAGDKLVCADYLADTILWTTKLEFGTSGKTALLLRGDTVYYINNGLVRNGTGQYVPSGNAFVAAYRKSDGRSFFISDLRTNGAIRDSYLSEDNLFLVFDNALSYMKLSTGKNISFGHLVDNRQKRQYKRIVLPQTALLEKDTGTYGNIKDEYPSVRLCIKASDSLLLFNEQYNIIAHLDKKSLNPVLHRAGNIIVIKGDKTDRVVKGDKLIAEHNRGLAATFYKGRYYLFSKDGMSIVPMSEFE